jgi:CRP-like cAMP-binding protein
MTREPLSKGPGNGDLPVDHALALFLADETEPALRWGAAALELGHRAPDALLITCRLLEQMGRRRAAVDGLGLAMGQAVDAGDLPLAMAAIGDLRSLGVDVAEHLDRVAGTFCQGAARLRPAEEQSILPQLGEFQPLSPFLTGPALASKAAQILESVKRSEDDVVGRELPLVSPLPLFSALEKEALQDLLAAFETIAVPAGESVIREGETGGAAFLVARGELEVSRRTSTDVGKPPVFLARLGAGAFFGEMALLSQLPGAASVVATRPSILLLARRESIEAVIERHPEVADALAAHCRRLSVANLGWASPVIVAVPPNERATLVDRFETRVFETGDKLVERDQDADGLHLVVSGEVAIVAYDGTEGIALATLMPGETVGEVELVLCRKANADAIATRPTATLYLPREEFIALVQDHPAILHGLYAIAVRRHTETKIALEAVSAAVAEDALLDEVLSVLPEPAIERSPAPSVRVSRTSSVPPLPMTPPPATLPRVTLPMHSVRRRRATLPPPVSPPAPAVMPVASSRPTSPPVLPDPATRIAAEESNGRATMSVPPVSVTRSPSGAPVSAPVSARDGAARLWDRSQSVARMTLVAAAAGAVVYVALRGEPTMNTSQVGAAAANLTTGNSLPAVAPPAPTASLSAASTSDRAPTMIKSHASAPVVPVAATMKPRTAVTVVPEPDPSPSQAHAAPSAPSGQPSATPSARPFVPSETKAPSKEALSAGDFGGRE